MTARRFKELYQFLLLSGARISEVIARISPSAVAAKREATGARLSLVYQSYNGEEAAVFILGTLKRKMRIERSVALPMNPVYEPWTKEVATFVEERLEEGTPPWPITRQWAYHMAVELFRGFYYIV